jgi:hypothetical protein
MERHLTVKDSNTLVDYAVKSVDELKQLADACKQQREAGLTGDSDMKVLAHVDGFLIEKWCNERGVTFYQFMRDLDMQNAFLNSPEIQPFRVYKGRV